MQPLYTCFIAVLLFQLYAVVDGCGAGYYNNGGCTPVTSGYYSPDNDNNRYACNNGYYCPGNTDGSPTSCAAGTYTANNGAARSGCDSADAGYYACGSHGSCTGATSQSSCAAGYYSTGGAQSCTGASAGYYACGDHGSCQGGTSQSQCGAGNYASGNAQSCTPCNNGYYCPGSTDGSPTSCAAGRYAPNDGSSISACTVADSGYYAYGSHGSGTGAIAQAACGTGAYADGDAGVCTACNNGYYCTGTTSDSSALTQCPLGSYTPNDQNGCNAQTTLGTDLLIIHSSLLFFAL